MVRKNAFVNGFSQCLWGKRESQSDSQTMRAIEEVFQSYVLPRVSTNRDIIISDFEHVPEIKNALHR